MHQKMLQFCKMFWGHAPRPPSEIGHVASYLPLDGHSHNPSLNFDSLNARDEFSYLPKHQTKKSNAAPF